MTAEHAFRSLCEEFKCSVDESEPLDDAEQIIS